MNLIQGLENPISDFGEFIMTQKRGVRKTKTGMVVSDKMDKTKEYYKLKSN